MSIPGSRTQLSKEVALADLQSLVGSGHLDKGAIVSAAGDSVWATSAGFTVCASRLPLSSQRSRA